MGLSFYFVQRNQNQSKSQNLVAVMKKKNLESKKNAMLRDVIFVFSFNSK